MSCTLVTTTTGRWEEWLESRQEKKDSRVLVNSSWICTSVCPGILVCTRNSVASWTTEVTVSLFSALVRLHLESSVHFWAHHYKEDIEVLENAQRRIMELMKGLEPKSYKKRLRDLDIFSLEKSQGRSYHSLHYLQVASWGWSLLPGSQQYKKWKQEQTVPGEAGHQEVFIH